MTTTAHKANTATQPAHTITAPNGLPNSLPCSLPSQRNGLIMWLCICSLVLLTGCASNRFADLDPQTVPTGFNLTLSTYSTDGKRTYFKVAHDGELSFGGGRDALHGGAQPVLTLNSQQRQEIWALIVNSDMLNTPNQMFKSPEKVAYDATIDAGKSFNSRSFHVTDESIPPALIQLHDRLFQWQADVRYKAIAPTQTAPKP